MNQPLFANSLLICDDGSSLKMSGGNRFIRKLPDDRLLGYLHKFYGPLGSIDIAQISDGIGRALPAQIESFLRWSNGASLFDNKIQIFGLVENISRSLDPEMQKPISIVNQNRLFSLLQNSRWSDGWTHIGSIIGLDFNYEIEFHQNGFCAVTFQDNIYYSTSFETCMTSIINRVNECYSCDGIDDHSLAKLYAAIESLFNLN